MKTLSTVVGPGLGHGVVKRLITTNLKPRAVITIKRRAETKIY